MNQRFSIVPVFYLAFLLIPLYWLLTMSFKPMKELAGQLTLYPKSPTLDHYQVIFSDSSWCLGYLNATVYVLMNVAICLVAAFQQPMLSLATVFLVVVLSSLACLPSG